MKSARNFLIGYALVYLGVSIGINAALGPAGLSADYLERYKADHDRYLSITKSREFIVYRERPHLHPEPPGLAFAEEYESRPAFIAETRRRARYELLFDVFRAVMVTVLIVRFAKAPLLRLIDAQIATIRERIEKALEDRRLAAERSRAAEEKIAGLEADRERMAAHTAQRLELERAKLDESARAALELLARETEDRKQHEEYLARQAMKKELVERALAEVVTRYAAERTPERETKLIDVFLHQLERRP